MLDINTARPLVEVPLSDLQRTPRLLAVDPQRTPRPEESASQTTAHGPDADDQALASPAPEEESTQQPVDENYTDMDGFSVYWQVYAVPNSLILPIFKLCHWLTKTSYNQFPKDSDDYKTRKTISDHLGQEIPKIEDIVSKRKEFRERPGVLIRFKPEALAKIPIKLSPSPEELAANYHILPMGTFQGSNKPPPGLELFSYPIATEHFPAGAIRTIPQWIPKVGTEKAWIVVVPMIVENGELPTRLWESGSQREGTTGTTFYLSVNSRQQVFQLYRASLLKFTRLSSVGQYNANGVRIRTGTQWVDNLVQKLAKIRY